MDVAKVTGIVVHLLFVIAPVFAAPVPPTIDTWTVYWVDLPKKCCPTGYVFDDQLNCVLEDMELSKYWYDSHPNGTLRRPQQNETLSCERSSSISMEYRLPGHWKYSTVLLSSEYCMERRKNGSKIFARCVDEWDQSTEASFGSTIATKEEKDCNGRRNDSANRGTIDAIVFWGAKTYMSTNVAHVILCVIVVVIYLSIEELGKTVHNRSVLRHNVCLLTLGCILSFLGYCNSLEKNLLILLWLCLQYFTIATVFWLNVICFDMTLCITRFRWTLGSGKRSDRQENRRLLFYGIYAWGGAMVPTAVAAIFEYFPGVPTDFPLKANYSRYRMGPNPTVNLYFFGIPLLTLFWNNVLFIFTTYKIVRIQRSTEIATGNQHNVLRKKYFLFLRLYLLMGAPWFFGLLFACLNKLVILKICRLIQPILWLLMLLARRKLRHGLVNKFVASKVEDKVVRAIATSNGNHAGSSIE